MFKYRTDILFYPPLSSDWLERLTVECLRKKPIQPLKSAGPLFKSGSGDHYSHPDAETSLSAFTTHAYVKEFDLFQTVFPKRKEEFSHRYPILIIFGT